MTTLLDLTDTTLPKGKVKVPPRGEAPQRLITVNGAGITEEMVRAEAQHHPSATPAEAFAAAAQALVVRELLLQEARTTDITATPETLGEGKRETGEDALVRALLDREISTPKADEAACRRYYDAHSVKFCSETIYEARHILFAAPFEDKARREAARQEATTIIEVLAHEPHRFAELARQYSDCPSKAQGGSLGQLTKGSTVPEFETILFALEEGQLSPAPVPTPFGYHVVQLDRVISGRQLPFEMVKERIAAWLEASSWSRAVAQYVGILAGKAEITGIALNAANGPLVQ